MTRIKQIIHSFIFIMLLICFMCSNYSQTAFALENTGVFENAFTWSIVDDVMTLQSLIWDYTVTMKNNNYIVDGTEWGVTELSDDEWEDAWNTGNAETFFKWLLEHPINTLELHVVSLYTTLGDDNYMRDVTNLIIGEETQFICDNSFLGTAQLNNVLVYSRDVDLTNSGIGYFSENDAIEDVTIYGYLGSTAETYANENGFTFIALDEETNTTVAGDVNADGFFTIADVILLQKWLLSVPDIELANWKAADFYEDDRLNAFDLCLMKRALVAS